MRNRNPQQAILLGGFIILIGVLTLIDNLNIFETSNYLQFWPMIFIALGTLKIMQANGQSGYFVGIVLIGIGAITTFNHLGIIHLRLHDWWPIFLIIGGLAVIFKDKKPRQNEASNPTQNYASSSSAADANNNSSIDILGLMSGNQIKNTSSDFKGGEINVFMAGVDLDLRGAIIQQEAILNIFTVWGGIKLTIPSDWTVVNHCNAIMGGIDDRSIPAPMGNKRLIVQGYAIMGGMEIRN
jgi:predicted membrane protein